MLHIHIMPIDVWGYCISGILTLLSVIALMMLEVFNRPFSQKDEWVFYLFSSVLWPLFWLCLFVRVLVRTASTFIHIMFDGN